MKTWITITAMTVTTAFSQNYGLNYEALSFIEEPLATEVAGFTVVAGGGLDIPITFGDDDTDELNALAQAEIRLERQLKNRWNVVFSYFGEYDVDAQEYEDNVALFVGGSWGTAIAGNLSGYVNEQTRRTRGTGNASVSFDNHLGGLEEWGAGYSIRIGPTITTLVVDEDSNFDFGASFQRPIGNKDYRFSLRYTQGDFLSADETTSFDTNAVSAIGQLVYGSSSFDVAAGFEQLEADNFDVDRWYASAGASHKSGVWTYSIEGVVGEIDGQQFNSAALGARYDIARGMSLNLGLNYSDADVVTNGVTLLSADDLTGTISFRYAF